MRRPATKSKPETPKASAPVVARPRFPAWLMAVLLGLATVVLYWPATHHGFVDFDDDYYVTANVHVQAGLTWAGIQWACVNPVCYNWHPVTLLSHMLDCQLYGLKPWGHHLTSILLHAANTALVFLLLRGLTGAFWRSAVVAALFGWHPVHVESVAWVAERKDVLSAFFGLLGLIFYARYVQSKIRNPKSAIGNYLLALFFLALGLMSKPMLVTWPFVMLLLDYWPLSRVSRPGSGLWGWRRLVFEKLPFFALAAAASVVTFIVQKQGGILASVEELPLEARVGNALISYCRYLGKLFWPAKLAVFYPYPGQWPLAQVLLAAGFLVGLSVLFFTQRRRFPFMLMGWLWFLGTLAPVIQLVQSGFHAMADRYTYIPSLGVLIMVVWAGYEVTRSWRYQVPALSVAGMAAIVVCMAITRHQLGYWQNSETLFRHALAVTENNPISHNNLGYALLDQGQTDEAISEFQDAIRLKPDDAEFHIDLGNAFYKKGRIDESISEFQEAIRLKPDYAKAHNNLGNAFYQKGRIDEAIGEFREAIRLNPDDADAHNNFGKLLNDRGRTEEAFHQFQEAIRLNPDFAEAHNNLGTVFLNQGQTDEAIREYQKALRLNSDYVEAHNNLGIAFLGQGQTDEAIGEFCKAIRLKPDYAECHINLGNAFYMKGRIDEAIGEYQETIHLKPDDAEAHNNLGMALGMKGQTDKAIGEFQEAIRLKPNYTKAQNNLARALEIKSAPAGR